MSWRYCRWLKFAALACCAVLPGCNHGGPGSIGAPKFPPVAVMAAKASQKTVPNQLQAIGTVQAYAIVGIKSRVEGPVTAIHFKEGDYVTQGQLLFTIDPRTFQAALNKAEADLLRDEATARQTSADEQRYRTLWQAGVGSRQQYDRNYADAASSAALVRGDKAAVETARLDLEFSEIRAPVAGRTGGLQAHIGDLIKADADTPIVTIAQVEPIYAAFSIPEKNLEDVRRSMEIHPLAVSASLPGDQQTETGVLAFVDNTVDQTTGTILLKGLFPNRDRRLWPGEFVNVRLTLEQITNAVLIPTEAIQTGQDGQFVFIIDPDMKVHPQPIVAGPSIGDETVIERGINAGATVVTDGQLRLMPGASVRIKDALGTS